MNNQTGLSILSAVLDSMSYPNHIVSSGQNISDATDVRVLHKYLMGGCYKTDQDAMIRGTASLQYGRLLSATSPTSPTSSIALTPSLLDEQFHKDFTNISDNGVEFSRGGSIYIRPCGWQRYALNVKGKYTDDIWLKGKTPRADQYSSAEEEWLVSYHGTSLNNGLSIAEEGFKLSKIKRSFFGEGIYSTPDIEVAALYSVAVEVNGKTYKVVMQNRVNPQNLKKFGKAVTGVGEYWISPNDDDIRPYGFCVREVESQNCF